MLQMYKDNWPIADILKVRMKNVNGRKPRCGRLGRNIKGNQETNDEINECESEEDEYVDESEQISA